MIKPKISVIVCCYNSVLRLPDTLTALTKQVLKPGQLFEVIIVDNNSTDGTAEFVIEFWFKLNSPIPIKVVTELELGLSNARKKGISESRGEIIIFCDDDNRLDKEYLQIAYDLIQSNPKLGIIGGHGIIETDGELPEWFSVLEKVYAVGCQYDIDGDVSNLGGYIWGAGMVIRKVVYDKLLNTGFQSLLSDRKAEKLSSGGDSELCILTKQLGYLIYYDSRLKYFHFIAKNRLKWNYLIKLCEGFARAQVYLDMYENCFNENVSDINEMRWSKFFRNSAIPFFSGIFTLNWYKILYLSFVENREGYLPGLHKRKYFHKMKELLIMRFSYNSYVKKLSKFI